MLDADGNIASGNLGDTSWVISADGKLTINGTGEVFYDLHGTARYGMPWREYDKFIVSAKINVTGMKNASYLFGCCSNLVSVDLSNFDTSNITDMSLCFQVATV